ncbi:hypothetical protein JCM21142_134758 [Saccharicrinis fermentans DSM 9555 = JCM 21142]|uniref:Uncharacterized protein n=1 Tax=Saccharicrinis fermentans DSM 9555 = JCM 21142 TaxID=869213 RepID=W7YMT8_9BACT|nr:hypothetical protein JCM21142_134758 [Saccharicrinis fermentans DSM 9555 = JCM 21142]
MWPATGYQSYKRNASFLFLPVKHWHPCLDMYPKASCSNYFDKVPCYLFSQDISASLKMVFPVFHYKSAGIAFLFPTLALEYAWLYHVSSHFQCDQAIVKLLFATCQYLGILFLSDNCVLRILLHFQLFLCFQGQLFCKILPQRDVHL